MKQSLNKPYKQYYVEIYFTDKNWRHFKCRKIESVQEFKTKFYG